MGEYQKMWEEFGEAKAESYLNYKFEPTHRIGLTNYLREELIYKFLNPQKKDIILDAGCASGRQLFKLADKIKSGYGTDIADSFINKAELYNNKFGLNNLHFKTAYVEKLPFPNDFFDKIICAEVLEHVTDKDLALKELLRVLKKNGKLIITVPNLNSDGTIWGRLLRYLNIRKFEPLKNFTQKDLAKHGDAHVREFNKKGISEWLKSYHLNIEVIKSVSFIDGPHLDFLLKFPLHFSLSRKIIIIFENIFTNFNFYFGRHLAIKVKKY